MDSALFCLFVFRFLKGRSPIMSLPTDLSIFPNDIIRYSVLALGIIAALLAVWWFHRTERTTKAVIVWIDTSGSTDENKAISATLEGLTQLLAQAKAEKITYLVSIKTFSHMVGDLEAHMKLGPRSIINPFDLVPRLRELIRSNYGGTDLALIYDNTPEDTEGIVVFGAMCWWNSSDMVFMFKPETAEEAAARSDIRYIRFGDDSPNRWGGGDDPSRWGHDDLIIETSRELFLDELGHGGKLS